MATIFNRGFVRRSLPVLLALVLGLLVAPQPASSACLTASASTTATACTATTQPPAAETVHTGQPASIAAVAPTESSIGPTRQIRPRFLRTQVTANTLGSRAPPSALR